jgi:ABC-type polysaccharide/polyol phosphate export permease
MAYSVVNPLGPVIDALRRTVLLGHPPDWPTLAAAGGTAAVTVVAGYAVFKKLEGSFADVA